MSALSDVQRVDDAAIVLAYTLLTNQEQEELTRIPLDGLVAEAFQVFAEAVEAMEKRSPR